MFQRTLIIIATTFLLLKTASLLLADLSFNRGYIENLKGNYTESATLIEEAVKLNKHEPTYYRELADSYCMAKEVEKCFVTANQALKLNPNNSLTLKALTKTFIRTGLLENALILSERLIAISSTDPESYYLKALALSLKGESNLAQDTLNEALKLKGDYQSALELKKSLDHFPGVIP